MTRCRVSVAALRMSTASKDGGREKRRVETRASQRKGDYEVGGTQTVSPFWVAISVFAVPLRELIPHK